MLSSQVLTMYSGIVASIFRTVAFATVNPLLDPTWTATSLLNWTIVEPGLYLLAACALSFKPLFRMIARVLHLGKLVTYTKSSLGKTTRMDRKTNLTGAPTIIRMDTFKSGNSGGFSKLGEGKDRDNEDDEISDGEIIIGKDVEEGVWAGGMKDLEQAFTKGVSEGAINVMVTRTVQVESEICDKKEDDEANFVYVANHSFLLGRLSTLERRGGI
jgi:hypothetical protein